MGTQSPRPRFSPRLCNFRPDFGRISDLEVKHLILPIIVGGLLAFLFRPVKERSKIPWLPHELQVLCSFAAIGLLLFFAFDTARKQIPDDKQKLEFKVRLKYKSNEKYQQLVTKSPEAKSSMLLGLIRKRSTRSWIRSTSYSNWILRKGTVSEIPCHGRPGIFIMDCEQHGEVPHRG